MEKMASPPIEQAFYPVWTEERVRFADTDMFGHVNHAAVVTLFEIGRGGMASSPAAKASLPPGATPVVRVLNVEYLGELRYPAQVRIGLRIARMGRSSYVVEQLILNDNRPVATASLIYVMADLGNGRSVQLTEEFRGYLETMASPSK